MSPLMSGAERAPDDPAAAEGVYFQGRLLCAAGTPGRRALASASAGERPTLLLGPRGDEARVARAFEGFLQVRLETPALPAIHARFASL